MTTLRIPTGSNAASDPDHHRGTPVSTVSVATALTAVILAGCSFGLFYAWVSTTMWGLDAADPRVAIQAMQSMNANIRNVAFSIPFFLPPLALVVAAVLAWRDRSSTAATLFGTGAVIYILGTLLLTMSIMVPMNEELAQVVVPQSMAAAETIWSDYSGQWQVLNAVRTAFCGITLVLAALGFGELRRGRS